jgi:hypothetical protein
MKINLIKRESHRLMNLLLLSKGMERNGRWFGFPDLNDEWCGDVTFRKRVLLPSEAGNDMIFRNVWFPRIYTKNTVLFIVRAVSTEIRPRSF